MGGVYEGYDEALKRSVAIKVLHKELGENAEFVAGFQKEAQAAAALNHPNVIQIHSFGQEHGQPYIAMELVSGLRLGKMIEEGGAQDIHESLRIAVGVAKGLEAAADSGLLHGDVKPENILLDETGTPKLADFGLAGSIGRSEEVAVWGTPNYIPPEKLKREPQTERSDMYSLGATLYHAIAGQPPFTGETTNDLVRARLEKEPVPLNEIRNDVPDSVSNVVTRMLRMDPSARHPTYASLTADIFKVMEEVMEKTHRAGKLPRPKGTIKIRKKKSATAAVEEVRKESTEVTSAPAPTTRKGSKIVVTRGKSGLRTPTPEQKDEAATKGEERKDLAPASRKKRTGTVFVSLFIIALIGGGTYWFIRHTSIKKDRRDRYIMKRRMATSTTDRMSAIDAERRSWTTAGNLISKASERWKSGRTAAIELLGEPTVNALPKPNPTPRIEAILNPPEPEKEKEESESGDDKKDATKEETTENAEQEDTTKVQEGLVATPPEEADESEAESAEEPPRPSGDLATDAPPDAPFPAIADLANVDLVTRSFTNAVAAYEDVMVESALYGHATNTLAGTVSDYRASNDVAQAAALTDAVRAIREGMQATDEDVEKQLAMIKDHLTRAGRALARLEKMDDVIRGEFERAETIVAERKAAWEAEESERTRRAADARERTERTAAGAREKEALETLRAENKQFVLSHDYREAVRVLNRRKKEFVTEDGAAGFQSMVEGFSMLVDLRKFLVNNLKENSCPWCWRTKLDVTGADPKGIRVTDQKRLVPWADVLPRDYLALIRHYLKRENSKASRQQRGRMALAAAVYCHHLDAKNAARGFRDQSLDFWSNAKFIELAERLLPGVDEDDE